MFSHAAFKPSRVGLAGPVALLLLLVALVWAAGDRMLRLEFAIYDFLQSQWPAAPSDQVLLVDTGPAVNDLWTDPRMPAVIDRLSAHGAAVIVAAEPPPADSAMPDIRQLTALLELEQRANQTGRDVQALSAQLAGFREQFETRSSIEAALRRAGSAIVAMTPTNVREARGFDACARLGVPTAGAVMLESLVPAREMVALPASICQGVAGAGYAGFRADPDGTVRQSAFLVRSGDRAVPSLALAAVAHATGATAQVEEDGSLMLDGEPLPMGANQATLLRFYGDDKGNGSFELLTADDVLAEGLGADMVRGRTVILGPLVADTTYRTSVDPSVSGMVLTATSVSNLLQNDYLVRPAWLPWGELVLLVALATAFLLLAPGLSLNGAALAALAIGGILIIAEAYLLLAHGLWARLGLASVFSALGIAAIVGLRYLRNTEPLQAAAPHPVGPKLNAGDELDLAFSVLRQQPPTEETKERLYNIAVNHGRRREFAKAERVLRYLASIDPSYRGVSDKLRKLSGAAARRRGEEQQAGQVEAQAKRVPRLADKDGRQHLGRYEVIKVLGRGAMATVYLGQDPKINRKVAIKTIALAEEFSAADLQAAKEQFLREAESAGRLNHPNIVAIYDVGEDDDVAYLAMEYFEGKSLSYYATSSNLLPPKWVLELGARAAEALHYAHSQNVVHRDIKPANIMYNADTEDLKLTDFGIARLTDTSRTKTGIILGTPSYMSPEQLSGSPVNGQSDLYSLGITLFHLLTGAPPFRADSIPKLMDKIVNERHATLCTIRDDLPPSVDDLFDRVLAKDPADRFANGRAMALALRDCCSKFPA